MVGVARDGVPGYHRQLPDVDTCETQEWIDSLDAVVAREGRARARYLLSVLLERAEQLGVGLAPITSTPYVNTIPAADEAWFPGDEELEARIRAHVQWNAAAMVTRANLTAEGIGGHLATYASSAVLYEVAFNHFLRGKARGTPGDHVYFQGHASPGVYARAFLEGRLTGEHLDRFRRETGGGGLSSYPHPRLMPDFWEFPTVSMGLGPLCSIYHARFNRYLLNRELDDTSESRVWCFLGDGECDEPETLGALTVAAREGLDNLVWVVNCNLQRLDGPVRGNGKVVQELEAVFRGAGWNVIKVLWDRHWDDLLAADRDGVLVDRMLATVDGDFQRHAVEAGAHLREHFFGPDPRLRELVAHLADDELGRLGRGGHDVRKVYCAYHAACAHRGAPTVVLAKTVKGWGLGSGIEGRNASHQVKTLGPEQLLELRDRLGLEDAVPEPVDEEGRPPYVRLRPDSDEWRYLVERRQALGGPVPQRPVARRRPLAPPSPEAFEEVKAGSGELEVSTTTAFTRLLRNLCRDPDAGPRIVPIVPDEARTFGMDALFRELKIYAPHGQRYEPVDASMLLSYTESRDGQILEEGISEAGAMASFIAAGAAHATRGVPMVPFFVFYSMFGFQRVGDLIWAAVDARARGFLLGATAGRTTLCGEGLQHQDGHSHLFASAYRPLEAYDPAFPYEVAVIVAEGLRRMLEEDEDVLYYLTLYNENRVMPPMPDDPAVAEGIVEGLYRFAPAPDGADHQATVLFSGSSYPAAQAAQVELAERWGVGVDLWSVTSYKRLREEAMGAERWNRLHPSQPRQVPLVARRLPPSGHPVVAVTDHVKAVPDQVSRWIERPFVPLGTDGLGRSDTRAALRSFFEVDAAHVTVAVLAALAETGVVPPTTVDEALAAHAIDPCTPDPALR